MHGSEGGGTELNRSFLPLSSLETLLASFMYPTQQRSGAGEGQFRLGLAVEGVVDWRHEGGIVDQGALAADEEVSLARHFQVVDELPGFTGNGHDLDRAPQNPQAISGF